MPRRETYSPTTVQDFCRDKIVPFFQEGYVNENDFRVSNLDALRAFPDKAFKAFLARKILQLPVSIASAVFDLSSGLVSQADATEVTYSRSGTPRRPNAYSQASREYMTEQGFFGVPSYDRRFSVVMGPSGILTPDKKAAFKNFARLAIVQNRGVDVVSFQPRMVAGYMSERDALEFKNVDLELWKNTVARVMAAGSQASTPSTPTASRPRREVADQVEAPPRAILQLTSEDEIQLLIGEGMDRDGASQLVEAFNDIGLAVYVSSERDGTLELRVPGTDNSFRAPSELEVRRVFNGLNTVNLRTLFRATDRLYRATVTFPGQSSQASQAPQTVDVSQFGNRMTSLGYNDAFVAAILTELNNRGLRIIDVTLIDEVVYGPDVTNSFVLTVSAEARIAGLVYRELREFFTNLYRNNNYVNSAFVTRGDNSRELEIRFYHTEVHEDDSDVNAIEGVTAQAQPDAAVQRGIQYTTDYEAMPERFRNVIPLGAYARCRSFGWVDSNIRQWAREFINRRLKVSSVSTYSAGTRENRVRYLGLYVIGFGGIARAIRPQTWLTIMSDSLLFSQGRNVEVRVMVAGSSYIQPARFRRNPTRGNLYLPLITISEPLEYVFPAQGPSDRATPTDTVINDEQRQRLIQAGWTDAEVSRWAQRLFVFNARVAQVDILGNTVKIEGTYQDRQSFFTNAETLRNSALIAINNRMRRGNADASIGADRWTVEMRNIDLLGSSALSGQGTPSRQTSPDFDPQGDPGQAATTAEPTTGPTQRNDIYFVGYQQAPAGRLFRSGNLPFIRRDTAQETGEYSYMLYFWDDSRKEFYQLPAGRMRLLQGASLRGYDLLNLLTQDPQGQLKVYTSPQVNGLVSQAVLAFLNTNPAPSSVSFTPQRLPTRVADARIEVGYYNYGSDTYFSIEGRPQRLAILANQTRDTIQRSDMPVGGTATASATPSITLLSRSQLKTLATSPYSFGFGIEFEGFVREGTRKELSEKMREDGIKIYTTTGYRSKTPVRGEEPYRRGAKWRQESDGSVEGYDARSSGGSDPRGQGQTFEMVSVVLNSSADNKSGNNTWIPELETYCDSLAKNGVLIDPSSGIHIHVGHPNFNAEQTKNLFINSVLMIPVLKGLVSEAWKDRGYARFPNDSNLTRKLSDIANAANDQRSVVRAYRGQFGSERYSYLNTSNFTSTEKPTFEYRFQGSSIEKDTMINTVRILQQIWKASLQGVIPIEQGSGKQQDSVLVDLFGKELFSFARNRYAETELPLARDRSSKKFPGYKFPINASSIT